ncbi:unnamed protein product [Lepeophtheirus salmonis]|uniref:(salmon louse) hypothetical protein n=1 Tax=Lepeophtheirus salmonis TaxID=72036 RepID=A0A7R8CJ71_LEPSM|nr:unnamed protein product [Lepeophtheirus salmonis]CAF2802824.1 unnamed protein product [Lepeophtheirus salmonis]
MSLQLLYIPCLNFNSVIPLHLPKKPVAFKAPLRIQRQHVALLENIKCNDTVQIMGKPITEFHPIHILFTMILYLHPDMNGTTFEGRVSISIDVRAPRDFLVTHINFLNITSTELISDDNGEKVSLESSFEYKPNEFWGCQNE